MRGRTREASCRTTISDAKALPTTTCLSIDSSVLLEALTYFHRSGWSLLLISALRFPRSRLTFGIPMIGRGLSRDRIQFIHT